MHERWRRRFILLSPLQLLGLEMAAATIPCDCEEAVEHPATCCNILGMSGFKLNSDLELPGFVTIGLGLEVTLHSLRCCFVLRAVTKSRRAFPPGL